MLAELDALIAAHPLRERLHGQRMRALQAAGRTAEALAAYEGLRATLADALGADPSPELRALHAALLRDDRTNLRPALTSFVGRDDDVRRVDALLGDARLVTLTGPGGAGKTRLATEAGRRWSGRMPDGVWMVELAGLQDPAEVTAAVLGTLGRRSLAELRDRSLLLVLDNCEHLVEACAHLAEDLLAGCPGVRILATSREPLAIGAEVLMPSRCSRTARRRSRPRRSAATTCWTCWVRWPTSPLWSCARVRPRALRARRRGRGRRRRREPALPGGAGRLHRGRRPLGRVRRHRRARRGRPARRQSRRRDRGRHAGCRVGRGDRRGGRRRVDVDPPRHGPAAVR